MRVYVLKLMLLLHHVSTCCSNILFYIREARRRGYKK